MQKKQRTAIARIFADLIKADRIIDSDEMDCWQRICAKYAIDSDIKSDALSMSFAEALHIICSGGANGPGGELLADCRAMTVSDGFCAHSEALVMITLMLTLEPEASMLT